VAAEIEGRQKKKGLYVVHSAKYIHPFIEKYKTKIREDGFLFLVGARARAEVAAIFLNLFFASTRENSSNPLKISLECSSLYSLSPL
jgi:hypothetical protein